MVYDTIMGVGRSPQVLSDIITNPFTTIPKNISNTGKLTATSTNSAEISGDIQGLINENNDGITEILNIQLLGGTNRYIEFKLNLDKIWFLNEINFVMAYNIASGSTNSNFKISISNNDIIYDIVYDENVSGSGGNVLKELKVFYKKARFIKVRYTRTGSTTQTDLKFYNFKVLSDNLQQTA